MYMKIRQVRWGIIREQAGNKTRAIILYLMPLSVCESSTVVGYTALTDNIKHYHMSVNGSNLDVKVKLEQDNDTLQVVYERDYLEFNVYLTNLQKASVTIKGDGYIVVKYKHKMYNIHHHNNMVVVDNCIK